MRRLLPSPVLARPARGLPLPGPVLREQHEASPPGSNSRETSTRPSPNGSSSRKANTRPARGFPSRVQFSRDQHKAFFSWVRFSPGQHEAHPRGSFPERSGKLGPAEAAVLLLGFSGAAVPTTEAGKAGYPESMAERRRGQRSKAKALAAALPAQAGVLRAAQLGTALEAFCLCFPGSSGSGIKYLKAHEGSTGAANEMSLESLFEHIIFTEHQAEESRRALREGQGPWPVGPFGAGCEEQRREGRSRRGVCNLEGTAVEKSHANCF